MNKEMFCDPLEYELDNDTKNIIISTASDDFLDRIPEVFFFGKIISENDWIIDSKHKIDEKKYYAKCPNCEELFKLKTKPCTGDAAVCPSCGQDGDFYNFRDKKLLMDNMFTQPWGYLETFEKGYVLRLFEASLTYEERDYDDFTTLGCSPDLAVLEVGREYWCEGKVTHYINRNFSVFDELDFEIAEKIDDEEFYIINYENDFDEVGGSQIVSEIVASGMNMSFMQYKAMQFSYQCFKALKQYGFEKLCADYVYAPFHFVDSPKISEILAVDYNQIITGERTAFIDIYDVLAARSLTEKRLPLTKINIDIMKKLDTSSDLIINSSNMRKVFKYLRNQISKTQGNKVIIAKDYCDYIKECVKLGYDLTSGAVRFPSNVQQAHKRTAELVKLENSPEVYAKVQEAYNRCHKLCEWKDKSFAIIMPKSCDEIIEEGAVQNHCVGGYCERVAKGEDIILFLRRVDALSTGFYTIEIKPIMKKLTVVQCRGKNNIDESTEVADLVKEFLKKYAKWFDKRPAQDVQCQERRKYYKAVHKTSDGKYISNQDGKTEYIVGKIVAANMCEDPDRVAVNGIHLASLKFAQNYGTCWHDVAILEVEVDIEDVVIPNAKDQIRTSSGMVLREVPYEEMGEWGKARLFKPNNNNLKLAM